MPACKKAKGATVAAYPDIRWLHVLFSFTLALILICLFIMYWLERE